MHFKNILKVPNFGLFLKIIKVFELKALKLFFKVHVNIRIFDFSLKSRI
jgi:hypothetical protein